MNENPKIGVFLCGCGEKIGPFVDLNLLAEKIGRENRVSHCEILPFSCLKPGIEKMTKAVSEIGLNRLILAGCEGRLMLKKIESQMDPAGIAGGAIDMINLRGHVAAVSGLSPEKNAEKAEKLIMASVAEMAVFAPAPKIAMKIEGAVAIVGGGFASFSAALELSRRGIPFLLPLKALDPETILDRLHLAYPGEHSQYGRLRATIAEVMQSPAGTLIPPASLTGISGVTGDYKLTFSDPSGGPARVYRAGAIIPCFDAGLTPPGPGFGHDGKTVLSQPEMEEYILRNGAPSGRVVFWISDHETGQKGFAGLSARSAWSMARRIRETSGTSRVSILYHQEMPIPLSGAERAVNRKLGISWIPYDGAIRPALQDRFITFCGLSDHVEQEIGWDFAVLSPVRAVEADVLRVAKILGLILKKGFLTGHDIRVRPEMIGREETGPAGSASAPCDLPEALAQGTRAGSRTADLFLKAAGGEIFTARSFCKVDPEKCVGCGECQELCDCGSIGVAEGTGGGLPRIIDPMICTGGGTCAAACPYRAIELRNSTNEQREARIAEISARLADDEVAAYACMWGGLPAADIAGERRLSYDPRVHILGVPCVGQIDPCVMARAFMEGAPGLILIGCLPEECHHSQGVDHAMSRVNLIKKLLELSGFDRSRIALAHADLKKPEEFVRTVEAFTRGIGALGPIGRDADARERLETIYELVKLNTRVRHLVSAGMRRPSEGVFRGDQRHALEYDRDFTAALREEYLQHRLLRVLRNGKKPLGVRDLAGAVQEDESQVKGCLWNMANEGVVHFTHKNREAFYSVSG